MDTHLKTVESPEGDGIISGYRFEAWFILVEGLKAEDRWDNCLFFMGKFCCC